MIRRATEADFDDIIAIGHTCYRDFNDDKARAWLYKAYQIPNALICRTENAWGASSTTTFFYEATPRGSMQFLACRPGSGWEACKVLKFMRDWALIAMGATSYHFGEDTGVNMEPLARYIGAVPESPTYVVKLHGQRI